eukprot:170916_1
MAMTDIISTNPDSYEQKLKDPSTQSYDVSTGSTFVDRRRSAMPSFAIQCKFEWQDLNVYVGNDMSGNRKQILHNFHGSIESGQLLAVMGGSGAGKSTLLNALSGRTNLNQQTITGHLLVNNKKIKCCDQKTIKSICTFVPQSDILCATQTVHETLTFYARLKLSHLTPKKRQKRVHYLIKVLHLDSCRDCIIGSESRRGISGGEKRRVSIAAEILNDTDIIFLDEPTSGLDAYTAARCIKTLKQFCCVSNKIIIATIHQPSMEVFYLFDRLMLLADGQCCYNSSVHNIDTYFKDALRPKTNPADVVVFACQRNANKYAVKWSTHALNTQKKNTMTKEYFTLGNADADQRFSSIRSNTRTPPRFVQFVLLSKREFKALLRNPRVSIVRFIQILFFALASGFCYFHIAYSFQERAHCFFLMILMPLLYAIVSLLTAFPSQKLLFEREYSSKTYNIVPWALSFMMIEIPREIVHMLLFTLIIYYMVGVDGDIFKYWLTFILTSLTGGSVGIIFGTVCKSTVEAAQAVPAALVPLIILSDAVISVDKLPVLFQYIVVVNPLYYLIRCLYIIEFYGVEYPKVFENDDEETLCSSYDAFINRTSTSYNRSISNIFAWVNGFNCSAIPTLSTRADISLDIGNWSMENMKNEKDKLDVYCAPTVSWRFAFDYFKLDADSLIRYWLIVLAICVVLRLVSILLLLLINNNGFSWMHNKLRTVCKCCCKSKDCSCVCCIRKDRKNKMMEYNHYDRL